MFHGGQGYGTYQEYVPAEARHLVSAYLPCSLPYLLRHVATHTPMHAMCLHLP